MIVTAYPGHSLLDTPKQDAMGARPLMDFFGNRIGTVTFTASWPINSHVGNRMYQMRATIDGVPGEFTGRGLGAGMSVVLRPVTSRKRA